jgi:hypothetical protein
MSRPRRSRAAVILAGAVALSALLSGCSLSWLSETPGADASMPTVDVLQAFRHDLDLRPLHPPLDVNTLLGSADVAAADGSVSAHIDIVYGAQDTVALDITAIQNTRGEGIFPRLVADASVQPGACNELLGGNFGPGALGAEGEEAVGEEPNARVSIMRWDRQFTADPRWLQSVVLIRQDFDDPDGCIERVLAIAPVTWAYHSDRPPVVVADPTGPTAGAEGAATKEDGVPVRYTVERDDTFRAVADRFGITVPELLALNPRRDGAPFILSGETLNLVDTPAARAVYYTQPRRF